MIVFLQITLIFILSLLGLTAGAVPSSTDHPQGALWNLIERGQHEAAQELEHRLAEVLQTAPLKNLSPIRVAPGFSASYVAKFSENIYAVLKETDPLLPDSHLRETAAYRMDRLLGLNMIPLTVPRQIDGKNYSLQLFYPMEQKTLRGAESDLYLRAGDVILFDVLIANGDRAVHQGHNVIPAVDGRLVAIDHARTFVPFEIKESPDKFSAFFTPTAEFKDNFMEVSDQAAQNTLKDFLPQETIRAVQRRLLLLKRVLAFQQDPAKTFLKTVPPLKSVNFETPLELKDQVFFDALALEKALKPADQEVLMGGELLQAKKYWQFATGVFLRNWLSYKEPLRRQLLQTFWSKHFISLLKIPDPQIEKITGPIVDDIVKLDKTKGFLLRPESLMAKVGAAMADSSGSHQCAKVFGF